MSIDIDGAARKARFARLLDDEERRLTRVIEELRSVELDERRDEHDPADRVWNSEDAAAAAGETLAQEVGRGLVDDFSAALADVDGARRRLAEGHYGTCERCRVPIDEARLEAVPATRWCVTCAAESDQERRWRRPSRTTR
jgi:RNA polymerase-binding transcription factor DksA